MSHTFFFSANSVNLGKCLLYAKQAVSNTRLTNSYLSAHYVPDCCDAKVQMSLQGRGASFSWDDICPQHFAPHHALFVTRWPSGERRQSCPLPLLFLSLSETEKMLRFLPPIAF